MNDVESPEPEEVGAPVTRFEDEEPSSDEPTEQPEETQEEERGNPEGESDRPEYIEGLRVFELAQNMPEIVGGLGGFYMHIDYPKEAVEQRIQGRLVLSFVVDADGEPRDISVLESLHPLCDSAAVEGLRATRFIPGRRNGEAVAVRMHLPVRFRLVDNEEGSLP